MMGRPGGRARRVEDSKDMPTYQYVCTDRTCGATFERAQSFTEPAVSACPECAQPVRKVYSSVGVVFKGSGFYRTDSRNEAHANSTKKAAQNGAKAAAASNGASAPDSGSDGSRSGASGDAAKNGSAGPGSANTGSNGSRATSPNKAATPA
jgi:putative FmdB family regulatory protein